MRRSVARRARAPRARAFAGLDAGRFGQRREGADAPTTSLSVPNDPVFVGLPIVAQGSCLDPLGVSSFGTTVTEGVLMVIGG